MEQQILNDGENKGVIRGKINGNFTELYGGVEANAATISALQAEASAKWVLLNTVDNRSRANETELAELRALVNGLLAR